MAERGKVIQKEDGFVLVSHTPDAACGKCGSCSKGSGGDELISRALNLCEADVGDTVEIELSHGAGRASVAIYGIPLASVLAGFIGGYYIAGEIAAIIAGILLLAAAMAFVFIRERRRSDKFAPRAVRKVIDFEQERG